MRTGGLSPKGWPARTAPLWVSLIALFLIGACAGGSGAQRGGSAINDKAAPTFVVTGDPNNGKELFAAKGCIACHVAPGVPGATGTIGPNLRGIGDPSKRPELAGNVPNTADNLRRWIRDPAAVKPGTMMPNLNLTEKETDDLLALLATLR